MFQTKNYDSPRPNPAREVVPKNPPHKKPKTSRTEKNTKTIRGISRNTAPEKNAQHFPLKLRKFVPKNPSRKKTKTSRTEKKNQNYGDFPKHSTGKNAQHFPLNLTKIRRRGGVYQHAASRCTSCEGGVWQSIRGPEGQQEKQKEKKKTWGGNKRV